MKLTLMNKNGKYTSNTPEVLMTKNVHDFLSKEKNSPVQQEIDLILPEIKKFPLFKIFVSIENEFSLELILNGSKPGEYSCGKLDCYGFVSIFSRGTATPEHNIKIAVYNENDIFGTNNLSNFINNESFVDAYKKVLEHYKFVGIFDFPKTLKNLKKSIELIPDITILNESQLILGTGSSVVIFSPSKNGFLNKQGTFTSLSSALIFQSVAVAKTTIKKMNLGYVIFADVNIQIKQISEEQLYPVNDIGYLGTIIAQNEQEEIKQNFQIEKKQKQKRL